MRIENEVKLAYKDVLIRPKRSKLTSRKDVTLKRPFTFLHSKQKWEGVPIIAANMDASGTIEVAKELAKYKLLTCLHKFYSVEEIEEIKNKRFFKNIIISSGINKPDLDKLHAIVKKTNPNFICLDVANGYTERFVDIVKLVRKKYPKKILIAGNVATAEMTQQLIIAGADIVKVGIGPGSACTTRKKAGVGYPQLSAVIECADAAHGLRGHIIADGGCTTPGDVCKAFGGGADFVMLGGMFAGHKESGGDLIVENGKKYKLFYGSSSATAMKKHYGTVAKHRTAEGKTVKIPYRGPIKNKVLDILGGLRSCCTYIGAKRIKDVPKCTTFLKVTQITNDVFGSSLE
ncbi:MAG TPA: GMP reductase [candidate division WWE3 bacterium]|uniref:GMP reductase n=1 Tax=candidate division WWE3 bacterium TaxID=2053526 RepID=A0A7V5J0D2_UNCKA|nr:GMP reductase [candidate division WWE3 bacterium]